MRKTILAAAAALIIGSVGTSALVAYAAPPPPVPGQDSPPPPPPGWGGWMHGGPMGGPMHDGRGPGAFAPGTLALVFRHEDRALAPPDVQKIAEALLLWNGNHDWKVVEVAPAGDKTIGFALATKEGAVVARFTIDRHSGELTRAG